MANIKFRVNGSEETTLTYNPYKIIIPQSIESKINKDSKTIDGESIVFKQAFNPLRGSLIWTGFPTSHSSFRSQVDYMDSLVGKRVEMSFGGNSDELGYALGVYLVYTPVKIISLDKSVRSGGRIVYDAVSLVFENAESL